MSLENRFIIRPIGYVQVSVEENLGQPDGTYSCLEEGHWAVHNPAYGILQGR